MTNEKLDSIDASMNPARGGQCMKVTDVGLAREASKLFPNVALYTAEQWWTTYDPESGLWSRRNGDAIPFRIVSDFHENLNDYWVSRASDEAKLLDSKPQAIVDIEMVSYIDNRGKAITEPKSQFVSRFTKRKQNKAAIAASLQMARTYAHSRAEPSDFDKDDSLVGSESGALLFGTIKHPERIQLIPHSPNNLITKSLGCKYDPMATCPDIDKFFEEIFVKEDGTSDKELIDFVYRALGQTLSGECGREILYLVGDGANGKSTFLDLLSKLFGSYTALSDAEALTMKGVTGPNEYVARLKGLRFLPVNEVPRHVKFGGAAYKQLTDKTMTGHFKGEHVFDFATSHTVWFAGNELPRVIDRTHAMWRRIFVIRFRARFDSQHEEGDTTSKAQDTALAEKLESQLPGLLNRILKGRQDYLEQGSNLMPPASVLAELEEYKEAAKEGTVDSFAEACLHLVEDDKTAYMSNEDMVRLYNTWSIANGFKFYVGGAQLRMQLTALGFVHKQVMRDNKRFRAWTNVHPLRSIDDDGRLQHCGIDPQVVAAQEAGEDLSASNRTTFSFGAPAD